MNSNFVAYFLWSGNIVSNISRNNFLFFEFSMKLFQSFSNISELLIVDFNSAYFLKQIFSNKNHNKPKIFNLNKFPIISFKPPQAFPIIRKNTKAFIFVIFLFFGIMNSQTIGFTYLIRTFIRK